MPADEDTPGGAGRPRSPHSSRIPTHSIPPDRGEKPSATLMHNIRYAIGAQEVARCDMSVSTQYSSSSLRTIT